MCSRMPGRSINETLVDGEEPDNRPQNVVYTSSYSANEPRHEISNNVVCATSKGSDQHVRMRSLIRAFASRLNVLWLLSY